MTAVIALCKCSRRKGLYGIRIEKEGSDWIFTWAFPVKEATASREKYDKTRIAGDMMLSPEYPGCPYCGTKGFFRCVCGKLNCWDGKSHRATCNWCGSRGKLTAGIDFIDSTGNF